MLFFLSYNGLNLFQELVEITVIDSPGKLSRFSIDYHVLSITNNSRITVNLKTNETDIVFSLNTVKTILSKMFIEKLKAGVEFFYDSA